jgi:hypothetical protein
MTDSGICSCHWDHPNEKRLSTDPQCAVHGDKASVPSKMVNPETLRVAADLLQEGHPPSNHVLAKYFHEAADEVERLDSLWRTEKARADLNFEENERLRALLTHPNTAGHSPVLDTVSAKGGPRLRCRNCGFLGLPIDMLGSVLETNLNAAVPLEAKHKCECGKAFLTVEVFDHHQECCQVHNRGLQNV